MAANLVLASIKICSFLTFLTFMVADSNAFNLKETKITVFNHDFSGGRNITDVLVAGIPGKEWSIIKFGTIAVADDLMTEGIKLDSKPIARSQGTYTSCSQDGGNSKSLLTILFTNEEYKGSTLELAGLYDQFAPVAEVPIISGTGKFRNARGYVTFETMHVDLSIYYAVTRCNITVQQVEGLASW